jgi:Na+/H+-translocating membrane pyrophosphatase
MQGAPYYPIMYAGLVVNVCLLACVSINYLDLTDNSEDHYYVENVSRSILIITLVVLIPMTFLFHGFGLPEKLTAGSTDFAVFQVSSEIEWHVLVYCSVFGLCAGFFICLLSEYFTSMNCPPSQKIAESSKKGLPVNLLKANSYSNVFAIITLVIMVIFISLCVHYAGGIGFAYGLMGLISFQIIAAVIQGAGGVTASAFRLTKLVEFQFDEHVNFAQELDCGTRQMSYVARGMNLFNAVVLGIFVIGYSCSLRETPEINIFEAKLLSAFVLGGTFPSAISYSFLRLIELNIDAMMENIN